MPIYEYHCEDNGYTVEVSHPMANKLETWGELCFVAQIPMEETDPLAPITRVFTRPPGVAVSTFNSEIKNMGFTKLVKRDDGVYENVTATGSEKRYMNKGDQSSVPHFHKKIGD
jgi:hypothetical protein